MRNGDSPKNASKRVCNLNALRERFANIGLCRDDGLAAINNIKQIGRQSQIVTDRKLQQIRTEGHSYGKPEAGKRLGRNT